MPVKVSDLRRHRMALRQENLVLTTYLNQPCCFCRMPLWLDSPSTPLLSSTFLELRSFWFKCVEVKVNLYFSATRRHSLSTLTEEYYKFVSLDIGFYDRKTVIEFSPILTRGKRLKAENLGFQTTKMHREHIFWHRTWLQYENIIQKRHFMGTYLGSWVDNDVQKKHFTYRLRRTRRMFENFSGLLSRVF